MAKKKIAQLTPEQELAMYEFRDRWLNIGLATGPADIEAVGDAIIAEYAEIGKSAPVFWHCESPLTAQLVISLLKNRATLGDNLWDTLRTNLRINLWANLRDTLGTNLRDNLRTNLRTNLENTLRTNLWINLWANLGDNLWDTLWANLWANLGANLENTLRTNLENTLRTNLRINLWDNLRTNLGANLGANLENDLRDISVEYIPINFWGSLDSYWLAFYLFPHLHLRPMHTDAQMERLQRYATIAENAFWWYPFEGVCFVCDRPVRIKKDTEGRLHSGDGSAVAFADGWELWYWHGVSVPKKLIMAPDEITATDIAAEPNAEVRMAMENRLGGERFAELLTLVEIDRYDYDSLYFDPVSRAVEKRPAVYRLMETAEEDPVISERLRFLRCVCPSTGKVYHQGVPPDTPDAVTGAAWLAGLTRGEYEPGTFLES